MNKVMVLDCTLRDGGYCNKWQFGKKNIKKIIDNLNEAAIDIIECGFLTNKSNRNPDITKFAAMEDIVPIIPEKRENRIFAVMVNYGEYDVNDLPECDRTSIEGIRVAFHKKDLAEALELCSQIKEKGYKVFIQAMVSLNYTDEEFLKLIHKVNEFCPYAFYIVDSFGMMKEKDLVRLFYMVEHNLDKSIIIGFHSHNNMQLAYSNAQKLVNIPASHTLIIDTSVYGMGRGAGNLNTELFVEYLNDSVGANYGLKPLLTIIDEILNEFYQRNYWGYSLPNYLSAVYNAHPSYAGYLDDKKTLTVGDMNEIFDMMEEDKKASFDEEYIEELYLKYMESGKGKDEHDTEFKEKLKNKKILLIAPGKSSSVEKERLLAFMNLKDVVSISVNFDYGYADVDFIFVSNLRRFRELDTSQREKCIATSNIASEDVYLKPRYSSLLNEEENIKDNAGMMAIKFLISCGVKEIFLAGFDGYSHDVEKNYGDSQLEFITRNDVLDSMNAGMTKMIRRFAEEVHIEFLTQSQFIMALN